MTKYRTDIDDYVEIMIHEDMSDKIVPLMDGNISSSDIITISKLWEYMMADKAVCYYHWMLYDPKLNVDDKTNGELNKKKAWDMFPGLAQTIEKKHAEAVSIIISRMSGFELFSVSKTNMAPNYTYKGFKWSVICFGKYYILEAYFPN